MRERATLFKALGDETRLQMLWLLMNHPELCVCDFMAVLKVTQSKASRHLRNLYHAGLVSDRRDGLWVHYSLKTQKDPMVNTTLRAFRKDTANTPQAKEILSRLQRILQKKDKEAKCL